MTDQQRIEELELQIGVLSEALEESKSFVDHLIIMRNETRAFSLDEMEGLLERLKTALASIRPYIEEKLKEVEEELELWKKVEWSWPLLQQSLADKYWSGNFYYCDFCNNAVSLGHTPDCKLSARIGKLEKKRADLTKHLGEM